MIILRHGFFLLQLLVFKGSGFKGSRFWVQGSRLFELIKLIGLIGLAELIISTYQPINLSTIQPNQPPVSNFCLGCVLLSIFCLLFAAL